VTCIHAWRSWTGVAKRILLLGARSVISAFWTVFVGDVISLDVHVSPVSSRSWPNDLFCPNEIFLWLAHLFICLTACPFHYSSAPFFQRLSSIHSNTVQLRLRCIYNVQLFSKSFLPRCSHSHREERRLKELTTGYAGEYLDVKGGGGGPKNGENVIMGSSSNYAI